MLLRPLANARAWRGQTRVQLFQTIPRGRSSLPPPVRTHPIKRETATPVLLKCLCLFLKPRVLLQPRPNASGLRTAVCSTLSQSNICRFGLDATVFGVPRALLSSEAPQSSRRQTERLRTPVLCVVGSLLALCLHVCQLTFTGSCLFAQSLFAIQSDRRRCG